MTPWLAPYAPLLAEIGEPLARCDVDRPARLGADALSRLNAAARARGVVSGGGRPLRFVAHDDDARPYETRIHDTGEVPTRTEGDGAWHDGYNALVWLAFPRTKARLNALQAQAIARDGVRPRRGALRDAATLLDENGAIVLADDEAPLRALHAFDWRALFVEQRDAFERRVRVLVFGHALLAKLRAPYKAICAHAWVLRTGDGVDAAIGDGERGKRGERVEPVEGGQGRQGGQGAASVVTAAACRVADSAAWHALDASLAATITRESLRTQRLVPLPVLGVPGWSAGNASSAFYNDPRVFRPARRGAGRARITSGETTRCTSWSPAAPASSASS